MSAFVEVFLRDLQEPGGAVTSVLVKPGDVVNSDQVLANVETEKIDLEARAPIAGTIHAVNVKVSDPVRADTPLFAIEPASTPAPSPAPALPTPSAPVPAAIPARAPTPVPIPVPVPVPIPAAPPPHASPALRRTARHWGVPLAEVPGTGRNQRILERDLQHYVRNTLASPSLSTPHSAAPAASLAPLDAAAFAEFGSVELRPLSRVRRASARRVTESAAVIPHVTQFDSADITELERFRIDLNRERAADSPKLTLLAFIIKACAHALHAFPDFNATLSGENIILKGYTNIGFATETSDGLLVPVLHGVDRLSIPEIARGVAELAAKAREKRLSPAETRGGCFTVTSLGGIAGTAFTPIINPPELAILGVSKHAIQAKWDGAAFQPRLMLPLSLSFDHRVIDGAAGARFVNHVSQLLTDLRRALF